MEANEPKVCRACYMSVHCNGIRYECECRCKELYASAQSEGGVLTPSGWNTQHEREVPIREAMRRVERDYIERERRQGS